MMVWLTNWSPGTCLGATWGIPERLRNCTGGAAALGRDSVSPSGQHRQSEDVLSSHKLPVFCLIENLPHQHFFLMFACIKLARENPLQAQNCTYQLDTGLTLQALFLWRKSAAKYNICCKATL